MNGEAKERLLKAIGMMLEAAQVEDGKARDLYRKCHFALADARRLLDDKKAA